MKKLPITPRAWRLILVVLITLSGFTSELYAQCTVSAGNDSAACQGSVPLVATPGVPGNYLYEWTPHFGVDDPFAQSTSASNVHNQTYIVTMTDTAINCVARDTIVVTSVVPHNDTIELCNDSVYLWMPVGGTTYNWPAGNQTSMGIWVSQLGTYTGVGNYPGCGPVTNTYTVAACLSDCSHVINYSNVSADPCYGDSIQFSATGYAQTTTWWWDFGDGTTSSDASPIHEYTSSATYTVTLFAFDTNSCSDTTTTVITLYDTLAVDAGVDTVVCQGSAQLNAAINQPGHFVYSWSPGVGLSDSTSQSPVATSVIDQTYTVTVTDSVNGCTAVDSVTISAIPAIQDTLELCGDSILLEMLPGATSYLWLPNNETTMSIWVSSIGVYTGSYNHPSCGTITNTYAVTTCLSECSHVISYNNTGAPCSGDTLEFSVFSYVQPTTVQWDFGDGNTSNQVNPTHTYAQDGSYTVTVITADTTGCNDTVSTIVDFNAPFDIWIDVNPLFGCQQCVDLSSSTPSATSYAWLDGNGDLISTASHINNICHADNETYILNASNVDGCFATDTVMVSSYNPVIDTFELCGSGIILDFGPGATQYVWQTYTDTSGTPTTLTDTTQTIIATQPGTYFGYANFPGCGSLTSQFVVEPCPTACWNTFSMLSIPQGNCGDSIYFAPSANTPIVTYIWNFGDGSASTSPSPSHFYGNGIYTASLTTIDTGSCSFTSQQILSFNTGVSVNVGPDSTFCQMPAQLSALVSPPSSNYTYQWSPAGSLSDGTIANPTANMVHNQQYVVTVTNTVTGCSASDSVVVSSYNNNTHSDTICGTQTATLDFGPGATAYNWQTFTDINGTSTPLSATSQTIVASEAGTYMGYADFPSCGSLTSLFTVVEMCPDSVWPGDANADGIANNNDILPVGIAYGATGPVRTNASVLWTAQAAQEWADTLGTGVNYKHVDCNGDGVINMADTLPIVFNYGLTHSKTPGETAGGGPQLYMFLSMDTAGVGTQISASIRLGTNSQPASNVYGLAFSINFDPSLVDTNSVTMLYNSSWVGVQNQDMIAIKHVSGSIGKLDAGLTRIDHVNMSGSGQISEMRFITIDNLSGKTGDTLAEILDLMFSDVTLISSDGDVIPVTSEDGEVVIVDTTTSIGETINSSYISLYPNPTRDIVYINGLRDISQVIIYDGFGRRVMSRATSGRQISVDISGLSVGVYYAEIWQNDNVVRKQVTIIDK